MILTSTAITATTVDQVGSLIKHIRINHELIMKPNSITMPTETFASKTITVRGRWILLVLFVLSVVNDSSGSATGGVAAAAVVPFVIDPQPASQSVLVGQRPFFYVHVVAPLMVTNGFQWRFNGTNMPGETNYYLSLPYATTNLIGGYSVVVSNFLGAVTSVVAHLSVSFQAPIFVRQPESVTAVTGSQVELSAGVTAGPPADYVLLRNGTNAGFPSLTSQGGPTFSILDATASDAGSYTILASNNLGSVTSQVATLTIMPAGPLDRWHRRNPLPQGNELYSVTYGAGRFLAVGDTGAILSSLNGTNWAVQSLRTAAPLYGVTYAAGQFVAVGGLGAILTSPDGVSWTPRFYGGSGVLESVAYGNGRFVAVGWVFASDGAVIATSTNGTSWESLPSPTSDFSHILFAQGMFVAVTFSGQIWTSETGETWVQQSSGTTEELESVAFGGGQFVAVGSTGAILTSPDGITWATRVSGITKRLRGITYGNSRFLAVGSKGIVLQSQDAVRWSAVESGTPDRLNDVAFANGIFVALGENGTIVTSTGSNWANETLGTRRDLDGIARGSNQVVVVGKFGTILSSSDGVIYAAQNAGTTNDLHGVGFGAGMFVAVGDPGVILTSSNTVDWIARSSGTTNYLKRVSFGNGLWVAVGDGVILTSTNGTDWKNAGISRAFDDVAYGNGLFVAVGAFQMGESRGDPGSDGFIYTSINGAAWSFQIDTDKGVRAIVYTNGLFLAGCNDAIILGSSNGLNWTQLYSGFDGYYNGHNLRGICHAKGLWTVVGNDGVILTSEDAHAWKRRASRTLENLHGVSFINDTLATIGNRGTILQSDSTVPRLAAERVGPNLRLTYTSPYEGAFRLQQTTNFLWSDLASMTNSYGTVQQMVPIPPGAGYRYYRSVQP